ncbi:hypothetical protein UCREL1_3040 [Eutypa lata UCREL1]|uniref:Uncharacterized protein n=1 Tax=Eutypa lata (strain UCR-EL1) TaxID=1287681 RepID=M7STR7_EUTLA|nr:hypothetical protein UCREL1_3040 [Eutypa lata UCREL1]
MERECINYLADIELDHDNKGENQDVEEDREEDVKGNKEMDEGRGHVAVKAQYMANEMWELIKGLSMRRGDKESMWVKKQLEAIELLEKEWDSVQKAQVEN